MLLDKLNRLNRKGSVPRIERSFVLFCSIICFLSIIFVFLFSVHRLYSVVYVLLFDMVLFGGCIVFSEKTKKYVDLLILLQIGFFFVISLMTGGLYSPTLILMLTIPVASNVVGNNIRSIESFFICIVMLIGLVFYDNSSARESFVVNDRLLVMSFYVISLMLLVFFVLIYEFYQQNIDKQRERLDRLKSEWISVVSHELRTPLTAIRGAMGLVHSGVAGEVSPQAKELIAIANSNCERLTRLVTDILDIEKMEQGLVSLQLRPCDLSVIVVEASSAYRAQSISSQIDLIINIERPAIVLADKDRVIQVIQNLLSNAIKFSPKKTKITISEIVSSSFVKIEVADEGSGIPAEFEPQVFNKFSQADSSSSRQTQGSGLGLAICRSIVILHKGSIGFERNKNNGTTFWFELPLYKSN